MARTPSTMLPLGTVAASFTLPDTVSGKPMRLEDVRSTFGTLLMFICNHCPYVKHINPQLVRIGREYPPKGIGIAAISSNDAQNYPEDGPEQMAQAARRLGYAFPYLYDESQTVAKAYNAACTPDFFLFDAELRLVYRGRLDDSTPGNQASLTGADLRAAMDALLAGQAISGDQKPSVGCNIKWKA
ncbi:MAG: thioredoxin family protein [Panacagrimonas sp.]